jgi:hypothetical protein
VRLDFRAAAFRTWRLGDGPEAFDQGAQQTGTNGFAEDMGDAMKVGFFLPLPVTCFGIDKDGHVRQAASEAFEHPDALNTGQFQVQNARVNHAASEEGIGFLKADPVDKPVFFRVESAAHGICHFRVWSQN